jgi:hypothetical protein
VQQQQQQQEDAKRLAAAVKKLQVDLAEIKLSQLRLEADRDAVAGREKAVRAEERVLHKKRATLNSRFVFSYLSYATSIEHVLQIARFHVPFPRTSLAWTQQTQSA